MPQRTERVLNFTTTKRSKICPATDPSRLHLPPNSVVCILGASRGIGASIAEAYAKASAHTIILTARTTSSLEAVAAQCKSINSSVATQCESCDVSSNTDVENLAAKIEEQYGRLDIVIYNSGYYGTFVPRVTEGNPLDWERCLDVNTLGTFYAAHHLLPLLLRTDGPRAFIVVSSAAAWVTQGPIANPAYCISKLAQVRLVEMMAIQYAEEGLLTVAVHPGAVETDMTEAAPEAFRPYLVDSVDLCGGFCVWLTNDAKEKMWLSGRFASATWDVEELQQRKEEVLEKNLLKAAMTLW